MLILRSALLLLACAATAAAQPFVIDDAVSGGGLSADGGDGIALAADGSRYVVGTFEGTATFGDVSVTSAGDSDIFLVKYDDDLDAVWARRAGTGVFNDFGGAVAVAPDGSVYATGFFTGIATFDGGDNPDGELTTFSDFDAFLAKYTPDGDLAWVRQAGGIGQDTGRDVAVDAEGNVYLVGGFDGTATFGDVMLTSAGSSDAFLAKYDSDGEVVWARRSGSDQGDLAYGVAVTDDGRAHVSGSFRGVALFGDLPIQSAGATDVFVVQYDTDGEPVWVEGVGADGSEFTRGGGIGLGPDGSVYVQGSFSNTILIASDVLESQGFTDIFVAKLTPEGNEVWGRRGGGDGTNFSAALAVDASGNALATGYVDGAGTFAGEPVTTQGRDGYLAVFDSEGGLVTVELLGGTGQDTGTGVAVNADRFAATGSFRGTASFGDLDLTSAGSSDVFVIGGPGQVAASSTLFVDADATGSETGLSWADAFTDLQDALALAAAIDFDTLAIWVAEGVYYPTDDSDRTVSFELQTGLALYGGFDGTEAELDQRNWATSETVLSGDIGASGEGSDNSFSVVRADSLAGAAILDGFTVASGHASGVGELSSGGGLRCTASVLSVRNTFFRDHTAASGAGAHLEGCSGLIFNVTFEDNLSTFLGTDDSIGGGGLVLKDSSPLIVNSRFIRNRCASVNFAAGGGVLITGSSPIFVNAEFYGNIADGADSCDGGAMLSRDSYIELINAAFVGNQCEDGFLSNRYSDLLIVNVGATRNQSGIVNSDGFEETLMVRVRNSVLWDNGGAEINEPFKVNVVLSHSVVQGGFDGPFVLNTDPLFAATPSSGPDSEWGTEDDNYGNLRLQEGSPAVGFGRQLFLPPDTFDLDGDGDTEERLPIDLDGGPRVLGNEIDLGAYESPFTVALEPGIGVPAENALGAAYPNPFRDLTTLALDITAAQDVTVEVFDVLGRRVATVHDGPLPVGAHRVVVEARGLPAGAYVVRAEGETFSQSQRVTVVR
ncbi:MAG: T9SS type A sorting domain-containing protein [Rhodothermales bacterium]